jgi:hypothetical protein
MTAGYSRILEILNELKWPMLYETGAGHEFISNNFFSYTGYYAEEVKHNRDFFPGQIHPEDYLESDYLIREWHKQGEPGVLFQSFRFKTSWGIYIWIEDYITEIKLNGSGKFMRGLMMPVDEEKQKEISLLEKKFRVSKMNEEQGKAETIIAQTDLQLEEIARIRNKRMKLINELFSTITNENLGLEKIYLSHSPYRG